MPIYRLAETCIEPLPETDFAACGIRERGDLQRLLRSNISVVAPDVLVIDEEFGEWEESKRRIDLLGVDTAGNLVVIELKRDDDAHMELQAIRYAAMVAGMTFSRAVEVFQTYIGKLGGDGDASKLLLDHLGWDSPREDDFAVDVRIVLVSGAFSKELTTAVLWLNERDLDIRCVRLQPYRHEGKVIVDAQQIVPLPEAQELTIRLREKSISRREAVRSGASGPWTGYWFLNVGDGVDEWNRNWEDRREFNFMSAGGGERWANQMKKLRVGDKLLAYASGKGYVGVGEVLSEAVPWKDFVPPGQEKTLPNLKVRASPNPAKMNDPELCEWCVGVRWIKTVKREDGVLRPKAMVGTLLQMKQEERVREVLAALGVSDEMTTPQAALAGLNGSSAG